jgi:hypothetical protein
VSRVEDPSLRVNQLKCESNCLPLRPQREVLWMGGGEVTVLETSPSLACVSQLKLLVTSEGWTICRTFIGLSIKARNAWNSTLTSFSFHSVVLGTVAPLLYCTVYYTTLGMRNG